MSSSLKTRTSLRSPLIWILLPWILGLLLSPYLRVVPTICIVFCAVMLLGFAAFVVLFGHFERWKWVWSVFFVSSVVLISIVFQIERNPLPYAGPWGTLPPREMYLNLEVIRVESRRESEGDDKIAFQARPLGVEQYAIPLKHVEVIFCYLRVPDEWGDIYPGSVVEARGVLYQYWIQALPRVEFRSGLVSCVTNDHLRPLVGLREIGIERVSNTLELGAPNDSIFPGIIKSILTGNKDYLDAGSKRQFREAGVMHFLAISGFHLSVVALMVYTIFQIFGVGGRWLYFMTLLFCGSYVWLVGAPVSAQRAWFMLCFFFFAQSFRRKSELLAMTIACAWVILVIDPAQLFDLGYQLSFTIVLSLITYASPLQEFLAGKWNRDSYLPDESENARGLLWVRQSLAIYLTGALAVSWTAFWMSLPLVFLCFGGVPFLAIFLNPLLAPLFALTLVTGVLSSIFGLCWFPYISEFLNHAVWVLLFVIVKVIEWSEFFPSIAVERGGHDGVALVSLLLMIGVLLVFQITRNKNLWVFFFIPLLSAFSVFIQFLVGFEN